MVNDFQILKKRLGEFWVIKIQMQCCCKRRKTNSRLFSQLENRSHGDVLRNSALVEPLEAYGV